MTALWHPRWCDGGDCETTGHRSRRLVAGDGTEPYAVDVALVQLQGVGTTDTLGIELGVTEDGVREAWPLPLVQAEDLASALRTLLGMAGER